MTLPSAPSTCARVRDFTKPRAVSTRLLAAADLAGEAEHVGIQPVLQQDRFLNLVGDTMRGGLVDDAGQCAKLLGAGGYSRVVQRICHLGFSFGWDFMGETIGEARSPGQQAYPYRILHS